MENLFGSREPTGFILDDKFEVDNHYEQEDEINSRISAQDDMYDEDQARKSAGLVDLYRNTSGNMKFMVLNFLGAQIIAQKIIIDIVNAGGQMLFDNYLEVKIPDYILEGTNELCAKVLITDFIESDEFIMDCHEDGEPVRKIK